MKKKLWIVSELFFPEETATGYYITEIAKFISNYQEVNIICGPISYEKLSELKSLEDNFPLNINIFRVNSLSLNKNYLFLRVIRFVSLTISLSFEIIKRTQKNDSVWLVTNPAFLVPFASVIAKLKKLHLTILVHDMFPENLIPIKLVSSKNIIYKFINYIFKKAYISADEIIVCGRDMAILMKNKIGVKNYNKVKVIENWADTDIVFPLEIKNNGFYENLDINDKIVFQFAGNIGRLQGLVFLLEIISECKNPLLHFAFIGEGAMKNKLKELVKNRKMTNVTFLNSLNRNKQNEFLNACDVGIVSLYDNMLGLGVPSKSYNLLAAGKPILYLGNKESEISLMVNEHNIGWQFEMSQKSEILNFFNVINSETIFLKGKNARICAENYYKKNIILEKYLNHLRSN